MSDKFPHLMKMLLHSHDQSERRSVETKALSLSSKQDARAQLAAAHSIANAASEIVKAAYTALGFRAPSVGLLGIFPPRANGQPADEIAEATVTALLEVFAEAMKRSDEHYRQFLLLNEYSSEDASLFAEHESEMHRLSHEYRLLQSEEFALMVSAPSSPHYHSMRALFQALHSLLVGTYQDLVVASGRPVVFSKHEFDRKKMEFAEGLGLSESDLQRFAETFANTSAEEHAEEQRALYDIGSIGTSVGFRLAGFHEIALARVVAKLIDGALPPPDQRMRPPVSQTR